MAVLMLKHSSLSHGTGRVRLSFFYFMERPILVSVLPLSHYLLLKHASLFHIYHNLNETFNIQRSGALWEASGDFLFYLALTLNVTGMLT